jgi:hypothetical protein
VPVFGVSVCSADSQGVAALPTEILADRACITDIADTNVGRRRPRRCNLIFSFDEGDLALIFHRVDG